MIIQAPSFAKINWFLEIIGRRPDGFHELLTLFQTVDLADTLIFQPEDHGTFLDVEGSELIGGRSNLVYRAAELLRGESDCKKGVRITLLKRIPIGGGLGGGSGNAAVTLLVLNYYWDCGLNINHLKRLAAELGSDVPYFLTGGPCIGWGRGENIYLLEELEKERDLVILYPGFQVPTALAYSLLNKPAVDENVELTTECLEHTIRRSGEIIGSGEWSGMRNDFEESIYAGFPAYTEFLGMLSQQGSGKIILTGSGSSLIAAGDGPYLESFAGSANEFFQNLHGSCIFRCRTLSRHSYHERFRKFFDYARG